mmetsp:Transcript_129591/g.327173  ORF Transcript_129591/g.327173 Transcript_129591/m.327173 type:complete len:212 (-) Transcript_129591:68-703(-)
MGVRLQDGKASVEHDRVHILNAIREADDLDQEPLAEHPRYDDLNAMLRGRVAVGSLRAAVDGGIEDKCFAALAGSGLKVFSADFTNCEAFTPDVAEKLCDSLPITVEEVTLTGTALEALPDKLCRLTNLKRLNLRCNADLARLPNWVGELPGLMSVSTAECKKFTHLPASFGDAIGRRSITFDLCNCPLAEDSWKPSWFALGGQMFGTCHK